MQCYLPYKCQKSYCHYHALLNRHRAQMDFVMIEGASPDLVVSENTE